MLEVKKRNIKTKLVTTLFAFLPFLLSSQFATQHLSVSDSIKRVLMQQLDQPVQRVDWKLIQKNRNTMPIFCKWELDIEDYTKIPVKFRLGSQEYVDRLEQKPNIANKPN